MEAAALGLGNALASDDVARLARTNQAVLDAVDDAIVLQDGDGAILLANPRARVLVEELFGEPYERVEDFSPEVAADRLADPETFLERRRGSPPTRTRSCATSSSWRTPDGCSRASARPCGTTPEAGWAGSSSSAT